MKEMKPIKVIDKIYGLLAIIEILILAYISQNLEVESIVRGDEITIFGIFMIISSYGILLLNIIECRKQYKDKNLEEVKRCFKILISCIVIVCISIAMIQMIP